MSTIVRRLSLLFMTLCIFLIAGASLVFAEEEQSGVCGEDGDNLTWVIENNVLTISGEGRMHQWGYESPKEYSPWHNNERINKIVIEEGVTNIGETAFMGCKNVTDVKLPGSMITIGRGAFWSCESIEILELPENVRYINGRAFSDCISLEQINIPSGLKSKAIYYGAFNNCRSLKKITIPDSIEEISDFAFKNCTKLEEFEIPDSVKKIGYAAFQGCTKLSNIKLPDGIEYVRQYAFMDCPNIDSVVIPDVLRGIGRCAFGCITSNTAKDGFKIKKGFKIIGTHAEGRVPYLSESYAEYYNIPFVAINAKPLSELEVTQSATILTYNGKKRAPIIKIKDGDKVLERGKDYDIRYSDGRKNVGSYSAKITTKGNYKGTKTLYFKIRPKGTSVSGLSKGHKYIKVNWKKQAQKMSASRITGYQISISTDESFENEKTIKVKGYAKASHKVSKLESKTKYYVKVRTYKTKGERIYYSKWSDVKTVNTK